MLVPAFILSIIALLFQGIIPLQIGILPLIPFVALAILSKPIKSALTLSIIAGSFIDLLSSDPFGIHALSYALIVMICYRLKIHLLPEHPLHLSLFSGVLSCLCTLITLALLFLFDRRLPFSGRWFLTSLVGMPMIDALYAFVWISAPISLFQNLKKIGKLFWLKRKNRSLTSH